MGHVHLGLGLSIRWLKHPEEAIPMEIFHNLIYGFSVALSVQNLFYCSLGCLLGTLIGVLPGIGPLATIAMLMPLTFSISPVAALIMLAGIFYGAQYGGSTTAILVNLPGETSAVVTCMDGYQMARQGRAGPALAIAACGSFFAGTVCTLMSSLFWPTHRRHSAGICCARLFFAHDDGPRRGSGSCPGRNDQIACNGGHGVAVGTVGTDVDSGLKRFCFEIIELTDGIGFVVVAVGVFAMGEIIVNLGRSEERSVFTSSVGSLFPSLEDVKRSIGPILRGTMIGLLRCAPGDRTCHRILLVLYD